MPRANFGGATDYSATFAGLFKADATSADNVQTAADNDQINQWQNGIINDAQFSAYVQQRLTATASDPVAHERWIEYQRSIDAKGKAAAQTNQDAADADTYSQWQNGQISDEQWLTYLSQRVSATSSDADPTAHEKWVELQRQYSSSIADNQAQSAHDNGTMSTAAYVAYLQSSLKTLDPGTSNYRDRVGQIQKLIEGQLASDTSTRAQAIIDNLASGKSTYQDLLKLYQGALKQATPGSDLANQITAKIEETKTTITTQDAQGALQKIDYLFKANKISGKEAGAEIRAIAKQYFTGDQTKYYQTLNGALAYEKYPGLMSGGAGKAKGSGGGGGGGRKGSGGGASTTTTISQLNANITRAVDITDQYLNGAKSGSDLTALTGMPRTVVDPATGQQVVVDSKTIHALQLQTLAYYDAKVKVYELSNKPAQAANAAKAKTDFIQKAIIPINTIGPAAQTSHLISSIVATINNTAAASNDPMDVVKAAQSGAQTIAGYINRLETSQKVAPQAASQDILTSAQPKSTISLRTLQQQVDPQLLKELHTTADALNAASVPGADSAAILDNLTNSTGAYVQGKDLKAAVTVATQATQTYVGLQNGSMVLAITPKGTIAAVPTKTSTVFPATAGQPLTTQTVPDLPYDQSKGQKLTQVYMNINGTPTLVWAVQAPVLSNFPVWQAQGKVTLIKTLADGTRVSHVFSAGDVIPSSWVGAARLDQAATTGTKATPGKTEQDTNWTDLTGAGAIKKAPADLGWQQIQTPGYTDNGSQYGSQIWVGDSQTGTWTIGMPKAIPDTSSSDGTIAVDEYGKPQYINSPHSTAGSVPVPYIGDNPKLMQTIYNAGYGAGAGASNSGMMVDSTGKIVPAPPGYYATAYYDPALDPVIPAVGSGAASATGTISDANWWKSDVQNLKINQTATRSADVFRSAQDLGQNRGGSLDDAALSAGLQKFAAGFGIKVGAGATAQGVATIPGPTVASASGTVQSPVAPSKISQPSVNTASLGVGAGIPPPLPIIKPVAAPTAKITTSSVASASAKITVPPPPAAPKPATLGAGATAKGTPAPAAGPKVASASGTITKPIPATPAPASNPQQHGNF